LPCDRARRRVPQSKIDAGLGSILMISVSSIH
jgi:hypothetical protein